MTLNKSVARLRAVPQATSKITKADRTKALILDAAMEFVWSQPFHEMTVSSLMAPTGLGRSAFYRHFSDLHAVMTALLEMLESEIYEVVQPWVTGDGDPVAHLHETLSGLIRVCYQRGPFLRAISDAAATDKQVEEDWSQFLGGFEDAGHAVIAADQKQGLTPDFDTRAVVVALNRLNAATLIEAFGTRPRKKPEPVLAALSRIWISTLYGEQWCEQKVSNLVRE
jgi:AcrR family transcriptional regulator